MAARKSATETTSGRNQDRFDRFGRNMRCWVLVLLSWFGQGHVDGTACNIADVPKPEGLGESASFSLR